MELHFGDQHAVNAVVSVGFYAVDQASEHFPITIDCAQIGNGDSVVALFRRQLALWPVIGHLDKTGCRSSEYLDFPQSRIAKFSPATLHVFDMEFYILRLNAFEIFSGQEPRRLPEWSARNRSTNKAPGGRLPESFRASGT